MPSSIIKPKRDEDFYVRYSTVVDSPCEFGTRDQMIAQGIDAERLDRADQHSSRPGDLSCTSGTTPASPTSNSVTASSPQRSASTHADATPIEDRNGGVMS